MKLDDGALVESVQACEVGEVRSGVPAVGNLDLVDAGLAGGRGVRQLRVLERREQIGRRLGAGAQ
jgi:hypothetical protein